MLSLQFCCVLLMLFKSCVADSFIDGRNVRVNKSSLATQLLIFMKQEIQVSLFDGTTNYDVSSLWNSLLTVFLIVNVSFASFMSRKG